jgi:hypothetical protein
MKTNIVTISKNRARNYNNGVILRCFFFTRHWEFYYNPPKDIPFDNKLNMVFWRGARTSRTCFPANRFELVNKWSNTTNANIDIKFIDKKNKTVMPVTKSEFLKYKYIISVEGNDKDSGINWKLNSNSLILMANPKITSWLMETTLIPYYHYVPLADDFSDLEEKLIWCNNHNKRCKQIVKNANIYMMQFRDNNKENKIEEAVINKYFKTISI